MKYGENVAADWIRAQTQPMGDMGQGKGDRIVKGSVDQFTAVSIYRDGTFTTTTGIAGLGKESPHDRLLGFDHDADSMRRKSAAGRGVAGIATGGFSFLASNNRGVLYVTVTGEKTGVQSFTTRNPDGHILTSARKLKAAADLVLASAKPAEAENPSTDVVSQIQRLAELHTAGVLTDDEFSAKKSELLGRI